MKSDLIKIIDVLFDDPKHEPDLAVVKNIAAATDKPIALMAEVVRLLWLADERPDEFGEALVALYE